MLTVQDPTYLPTQHADPQERLRQVLRRTHERCQVKDEINDGGPAFPTGFDMGNHLSIKGGMTLRDHFAAIVAPTVYEGLRSTIKPIVEQILNASVAAGASADDLNAIMTSDAMRALDAKLLTDTARMSFELADAMLKARSAK